MIIKRINLENYRSHKNTTIELSGGINLILGENGKGKSSILEAIGSVIFDINDRTGKKIGKSFIRYGENSANVEIIFIANDNREYSIKNSFYSKKPNIVILKDLKTNEEIKNKEEVRIKLNELCGIKKDYTDIYDNIIIAKQNEFINIFKDKASDREKVFNKIFNTEIYSNMYSGVLKDIEDKYNKEKERIETEKNIVFSNLKDEELSLNELKEAINTKEEFERELSKLLENKERLSKEITIFQEKERKLENNTNEIINRRENIAELKFNLKKNIAMAKKAKQSKEIVKANEENFKKYTEVNENLKNNRKNLNFLKKIEENNNKLINRNEILNFEIKKNLERIEENQEEIIQLSNEKSLLKNDIEDNSKKRIELLNRGKILKNILENIEITEKKINELEKNKYSLKRQLEKNNDELNDKERESKKISSEDIQKKLNYIEKIKEEILETKKIILVIQEKINTLEEAKEKLSNKICPLLMESCENVKEKNIDSYFLEKILSSQNEIKKLKKYLDELKNNIVEEKELNNLLVHFDFLQGEIERINKGSADIEFSIKKINLELEKQNLDIKKFLFEIGVDSKEILKDELEKIIANLSALNLDEKNKRYKSISDKIIELKEEIEKILFINKKNENEVLDNKSKIEVNINIKIFELEKEITELEEEQKKLQESYNIYLENKNISITIESLLKDINSSIKNIYSLRELVLKLTLETEKMKKELGKISILDLKKKFEETNTQIVEYSEKLGTIREKIENINSILDEIKLQKKKVETLLTRLKKIETKAQKTKVIRANIKGMGLKISKYMLESIGIAASISFNKITGRADKILWTNETYLENAKEKENKYAVYLVGKDRKIPFENLSGGEQVAVAISLRETMTKYFSNSRFIILDEPTNNLDKERKKLLAEYMGEILNNLDQSIIVTHDNTFREMAEKIIEL